jgi:tRNA A37 threonylcarbamoyladenosine synthetase subunit TsaC/SUA5/YrdC
MKYMSPTVINLKESEDLRDVVHRVVQALAEGDVVGVPTESN